MEKNCFSTITGKKFGVFYAIRKNLVRTPLSKITSTGEIEQRFRLN